VNAFIDMLVLALPIYLLSRTRIDPKRKSFIIGIFALGFIALLASFARAIVTVVLLKTLEIPENWILLPIFTALEIDIAITSASLPALSPLIRAGIQKVARYTGSSRMISHFETSDDEYGDTKRLGEDYKLDDVDAKGPIQINIKREYSVIRSELRSNSSKPTEVAQLNQWGQPQGAEKPSARAIPRSQFERGDMNLAEMLRNTGPDDNQMERFGSRLGRGKANEVLGV
jgi:hypothetical protein